MRLLILPAGWHLDHKSTLIFGDFLTKTGHAVTITNDAVPLAQAVPLGWTRRYGAGKVFVLLPGHDGRSFQIPAFQQLVLKGVDWATTPSA